MFQRKLTLKVQEANAGVQVIATLDYKYAKGPDCYCGLSSFNCMQSCRMERNSVVGSISMKWDLLFSRISTQRTFDEPKSCYTGFPVEPSVCKNASMVWIGKLQYGHRWKRLSQDGLLDQLLNNQLDSLMKRFNLFKSSKIAICILSNACFVQTSHHSHQSRDVTGNACLFKFANCFYCNDFRNVI